jgi:hypothetical protein
MPTADILLCAIALRTNRTLNCNITITKNIIYYDINDEFLL